MGACCASSGRHTLGQLLAPHLAASGRQKAGWAEEKHSATQPLPRRGTSLVCSPKLILPSWLKAEIICRIYT